MSYVIAAPETMTTAATDLATIGSDVNAAHMVAAAPTVALVPAAADEVSASIAHLFSRYAEDYHALAGRAKAFHEQFVQHLNASAHSYGATEAANAASLRPLTASAVSPATAITNLLGQLENLLVSIIGLQATEALIEAVYLALDALLLALIIVTFPISAPLILLFVVSQFSMA